MRAHAAGRRAASRAHGRGATRRREVSSARRWPPVTEHTDDARRPARCSGASADGGDPRPCSTCTACPTSSDDWPRFLARTGGLAPDLPGFGRAASAATATSRCDGYDALRRALPRPRRGRPRAPRRPRLGRRRAAAGPSASPSASSAWSSIDAVPLLPGYRWHRVARVWRTRGVGEVGDRAATRAGRWRRALPPEPLGRRRPGRTSTRAPSARSCGSTARARRTRWRAPAWTRRASTARRSSSGAIATPTSRRASPTPTPQALGGDAEVAAPARRRPLALARPARRRRPDRRVPRRLTGGCLLHRGRRRPGRRDWPRRSPRRAQSTVRVPSTVPAGSIGAPRPCSSSSAAGARPRGQEYRADLGPRSLWDNGWYARPSHARLQRALPAAGARCSARALAGALRAVAAACAVRAPRRASAARRAARRGALWFAVAASRRCCHRPADVRARRSRSALGGAARRSRAGAPALGVALAAGQRRWRARSPAAFLALGAARVVARTARDWRAGRARRRPRCVARGARCGRLPRGRDAAVRRVELLAGAGRDARSSLLALPREARVLRIGCAALRARARRGVRARHADGRQRRAPRRAASAGPLAGLRCSGARAPLALAAARAAARSTGSGSRPVATGRAAAGDPSVQRVLLPAAARASWRRSARRGPFRIEIPFTANHWEARCVAPHVPLARGWERQLDIERNALFYDDRPLTPARYRALARRQRRALRRAARRAAGLLGARRGRGSCARARPYLREVWRDAHWRLFAVAGARAAGARAGAR